MTTHLIAERQDVPGPADGGSGSINVCVCCQGNVVLWKPSDTALSASYVVYRVLRECGLPPNIIQFLPADGPVFGDAVTSSPHLAGINFTGSVP